MEMLQLHLEHIYDVEKAKVDRIQDGSCRHGAPIVGLYGGKRGNFLGTGLDRTISTIIFHASPLYSANNFPV